MSAHVQFKVETGIPVFFAHPHSPWQRGTNENTNGLLRQYFPKGHRPIPTEREEIEAVAHALNTRPRKTLGWKTPAEALNEQLLLIQQSGVESTSWTCTRPRPSATTASQAGPGQDPSATSSNRAPRDLGHPAVDRIGW